MCIMLQTQTISENACTYHLLMIGAISAEERHIELDGNREPGQ